MALSPEVEQWFRETYGRDVAPGSSSIPEQDPSALNRLARGVVGGRATFWPNEETRRGPGPAPPAERELNPPGDPLSALLYLVKPEWYEGLSKPIEGANPEAQSPLAALQNMGMAAGIGRQMRGPRLTPPREDVAWRMVGRPEKPRSERMSNVPGRTRAIRESRKPKPVPAPSGADIAGPEGDQMFRQMKRGALKTLTRQAKAEQLEEGTQKMYNEQAAEGLRKSGLEPENAIDAFIRNASNLGMTQEQISRVLRERHGRP